MALHKSKGFTLVEVLVGLLIVTFLFVGGYTSYREFARRQVLVSSVDVLKSNLNLARQKASAVEKPPGCTNTLTGYEVTFTNITYTVSPKCDVTNPSASYTLIYSLPSSVTMQTQGLSSNLLYKPVAGTNLTADGTITLTHSSGESRVLTVTPEGVIK